MRSRPDLAAVLAVLWLALAAPVSMAAGSPPTDAEVDVALERVKADPNLATERSVKTLEFRDRNQKRKPREASKLPSWLSWIGDLVTWIGQSSRFLIWIVLAAAAAWLIVFIARIFLGNRGGPRGSRFVAPTHVQDLDIRPESLPADIGAAARALWDRGEHRAAQALLYRGLLSRLAHVHQVPIKDSSTEGDCLTLAARTLDASRLDYIARLIRTWQRATYGGQPIDTATIHGLCADFSTHLDPPAELLGAAA